MANFLHLSLQINTKKCSSASWLDATRITLFIKYVASCHSQCKNNKTTVDKKMMNAGMYFSSVRLWNILQANVTCFVFYKDT